MASRKTISKWILGLSGLLVLLLMTLLLIAPKLLNSNTVRLKIQQLVTEEIGGRVDYSRIKIVYFPQLALQVERLEFSLSEILTAQVSRLQASPDFLQLASGGITIDYLRLDEPDVRLTLPSSDTSPIAIPDNVKDYWLLLQPLLQPLTDYAPGVEIELTSADFNLYRTKSEILTARDFDTTLTLNTDPDLVQLDLTGRLPELTLKIGKSPTKIENSDLSAVITLQPQQILLEVKNLHLSQPELALSGVFALTDNDPKFRLSLESLIPDLAAVRSAFLPLQEQIPGSHIITERILAGALTDISLHTEGSTLAQLLDPGTLQLTARLINGEFALPRLLHHVTNVRGRISVANRRVELHNAHIESGQSQATMERGAIYRNNKTEPFLVDIDNTQLHFNLAGLHDNLARIPALNDYLAEISDISGQLDFKILNLTGPLAELPDWKFKATGSIADTVINSRRFPDPVNLSSGSYSAEDSGISFKAMHLKGLDADLTVSGTVRGKIPLPTHVEASATGEIGEKFTRWFRETIGLPDAYALDTPITITRGALTWNTGNNITAKGAVEVANGPEISGDITFTPPKQLQVELSLNDDMSDARVSFSGSENRTNLGFSGRLQKKTINNIFVEEQLSNGNIEGDFALELTRGENIGINTSGELRGENLLLPIGISEPLSISDFAITGLDQTVAIDHLALTLGDVRANIDGSIASANGNYHLDLNLHTGPLDFLELKEQIDDIREELAAEETEEEQSIVTDREESLQSLPFSGRVNLLIDTLRLKHLNISPVRAEVQFEPQKIAAQVTAANLCGIDLLASAQIMPGEFELILPINAADQDLSKSSICMTGERSKVTGSYDLTGEFRSKGAPGELLNAARGQISLNARDGAIEQSPFVSQLLSVVNLTEFYRVDYLTLDKSKLGYTTLLAEGTLKKGRLSIPTFHFNGTTLEVIGEGHADLVPPTLNIELLVAPLKTVDTVVKWLPGINYLLAGNLVTIPVRITGPAANPDIKVIPVSSVGKGVLGIAERILKIPVKIVEPLTGDGEDEEESSSKEPEAP